MLTDLFAHHSATALAYAAEYDDRETTVAERRAVGQALGIVMERYKLSEAKAYALLQDPQSTARSACGWSPKSSWPAWRGPAPTSN